MSAAFSRMSCSICNCPVYRRSLATSASKSDSDGDDACIMGRRDAPVACIPNCVIHRRSTVWCSPALWPLRRHSARCWRPDQRPPA
jgi:hypothetical protein